MRPMLSRLSNEKILSSKEYIFEPKLDGYRALCFKNSKLKFLSRNNLDITDEYPEFDFIKNIKAKTCIIDGEIVIYNEKGIPSFSMIQRRKIKFTPATYIAFDILNKDGHDLQNLPLLERKKILADTIVESSAIQIVLFTSDGRRLWKEVKKIGLEGVIAKKKDSKYRSTRSSDWLKIKIEKTTDCVIIGYTKGKRALSSLLLGLYDKKELKFTGKVGTGFDEYMMTDLLRRLRVIKKIKSDTFLVEPKFTCAIKFLEVTQDKKFRAPVFLGLREDKNPEECTFDQLKWNL